MIFSVCLVLILFLFSAFFSSSETAIFSLTKIDKRRIAERHPRLSRPLLQLLEHPRKTLGTILIGNLLVNTWAAALTTLTVLNVWGEKALGIAMLIFTIFLIIFGEVIPKIFAVKAKERIALLSSLPLKFFMFVFAPFRKSMRLITDRILSLIVSEKIEHSDRVSEEELKVLVKIGEEEGVLDQQERYMIHKLLDLGERPVREIMVPRTDVVGLDIEESFKEHMKMIKEHHFSPLPVFQESLDKIVGVVETQEYLLEEEGNLKKIIKEPIYIPESKRIDELLEVFRDQREHFAICVDEYGGTAGIVTLEDILEEIFGDYYDEHTKVEHPIRNAGKSLYLVEAKIAIEDFNEHFQSNLEVEEASTLAGYLLEKLGEVPTKGQTYESESFHFEVKSMIRQRIHQVLVRKKL